MKIVVLVKEVPDTYGERKLNAETGLADRDASDAVLDEIGERAIELALSRADADPDTEVVVISLAPETASASLRKALAMGAAKVVHVADEGLAGADLGQTAELLAAAIRREGFDLVITGNLSTDGSGGVLPAMLAEHLRLPHTSALASVEITDDQVSGVRESDGASMEVSSSFPAIVSVTERLPEARFTSFKGIIAAKRSPTRPSLPQILA